MWRDLLQKGRESGKSASLVINRRVESHPAAFTAVFVHFRPPLTLLVLEFPQPAAPSWNTTAMDASRRIEVLIVIVIVISTTTVV